MENQTPPPKDPAQLKELYKDTLNLPQTQFPMKGNLPISEPLRIQRWEQNKIYQKMIDKPAPKGAFVMPDGPPYANGNIHLGHVLNKVLKDIVIKYRAMQGYRAPFIPGWDCHGLPIELKVVTKLGKKQAELTEAKVRQLCRDEATTWIGKQREQFQRLGILADWQNPYLTMDASYEAEEVRVLAKIFENGVLYRGEKPVYWSPDLRTAFAAAEVEYHDHKSPSIFLKFYMEKERQLVGLDGSIEDKPVAFVIWTTTPWTLPANYAVALNPNFEYGLFDAGGEYLIFAADLKANVEAETGLTLKEVRRFHPQALERKVVKHPFLDRDSLIIFGDHVLLEASGIVHTAPGHGMEDYVVGLKYGLPVHSPVDEAGCYTADFAELQGTLVWDANPIIVQKLKTSGHLLSFKEFVHSYPHNQRSKTPLIFRSTPQWFIRMDDAKFPVRQMALDQTENTIQFIPKWGANRLQGMLANAPDWCLSRQRIWGVPIPVFYCERCNEPLVESVIMNRIADRMESSKQGIEAYHTTPVEEFTNGFACKSCGGKEFKRGRDILDVWFDSGICHSAVQKKRAGLSFPADIYLEGSDQHRGWFQTSLLSAMASEGRPPFKALITHGFVNDAKGHKMSKSVGNVIDPADVIKKSGAEILRLWVAYEDYGQDVTIGNEMFDRITETYRRFRNTIRFLLGNLHDFDPHKDQVPWEQMRALDQWALGRLQELIQSVTAAYETYDFYKVYHGLNHFFTVELSATYLDIIKDRLYTWKRTGVARRSAQTVVYELLTNLSLLMAPIMSFLAEETFEHIPGRTGESVLLCPFPSGVDTWKNAALAEEFSELLRVRSEIAKKLEEIRQAGTIGASLDAQITLQAPKPLFDLLKKYEKQLTEFFIVSRVQLDVHGGPDLQIHADKALGQKCVRCWTYSEQTGQNQTYPAVCPKCVEALA